MQKSLRILLTGGGSGGHIFPLISIAERLRRNAEDAGMPLDIRYFGSAGDYKVLLEGHGIRIAHIAGSKWRRYASLKNIFEPFLFFAGVCASLWKLFWFMPDAAFSKGGPGALAILVVCRWYNIPILIHESDSIPGLTNLYSSKFAKGIELAFPEAQQFFAARKGHVRVTGMPVREEIFFKGGTVEDFKSALRFEPSKPLMLFLGGSQGAETINNFVLEHLETLLKEFQILHQVGARNFSSYNADYNLVKTRLPATLYTYRAVPFLTQELGGAMQSADLIVSRAGATAIFEIASVGKPSILIPISRSTNDHQKSNAYAYERRGAAVVIEEENLLIGLFMGEVKKILGSAEVQTNMSEAARAFFMPAAGQAIADDILRVAGVGS